MIAPFDYHVHAGVRCRLARSDLCQTVENVLSQLRDPHLIRVRQLIRCIRPSRGGASRWLQDNPEFFESPGILVIGENDGSVMLDAVAHAVGHVCTTEAVFTNVYDHLVRHQRSHRGVIRDQEWAIYRQWAWELCAEGYAAVWGFWNLQTYEHDCPVFAAQTVPEWARKKLPWWVKEEKGAITYLVDCEAKFWPRNRMTSPRKVERQDLLLESAMGPGKYTVRVTNPCWQDLRPGVFEHGSGTNLESLGESAGLSACNFKEELRLVLGPSMKWRLMGGLPDLRDPQCRTLDIRERRLCAAVLRSYDKFFPGMDQDGLDPDGRANFSQAALIWLTSPDEEFLPQRIVEEIDWEQVASLRF